MGYLKRKFEEKYNSFVHHNAYTDQKYSQQVEDPDEKKRNSGYSRAYHRYFEGYAERQVVDSNGKVKIERVYVIDSYKHHMNDRQWVFLKLGHSLGFIAACALYIYAVSRELSGNMTVYIQIFEALGAFSLFLLLYTLIQYLTCSREMTIGAYKTGPNDFKIRALISACCCASPILCELIYIILSHGADWKKELLFLLVLLPAPVILAGMYCAEKKIIKYDRIPYTDEIPGDAVLL